MKSSIPNEYEDHPINRRAAPESDFYVVPLVQAPERIKSVAPPLLELLAATGGSFVAGGCLRDALLGHPRKDIDVYFTDYVSFLAGLARLVQSGGMLKEDQCCRRIVDHDRWGIVDLIHQGEAGPLEQIRQFDFIACCAALHPEGFAYHRLWDEQVRAQVLRFNACPRPRRSLERVDRFGTRGWLVRPDDRAVLEKLAEQDDGESDYR